MGLPVVTVASGGRPVVDNTAASLKSGVAVSEATNGFGIPVTKVASGGMPVMYVAANFGIGGSPSYSAPVSQFLNRTSGLDATHTNAYQGLIDGLVTDGIWGKLDMLHIYATQDTTTAALNLVSSSYGGTITHSPTFTVDRGFTPTDANDASSQFIDTAFNATTAPTPKFVQNSAHISVWSVSNHPPAGNSAIGIAQSGINTTIFPSTGSSVAYFMVNNGFGGSVSNPNSSGHYIASRSSSSALVGYRNGASLYTGSETSSTPVNGNITVLGANNVGGFVTTASFQIAMASIGSNLTATDATNFYNRLRTYMTAVGVP